MNSNSTSSAGQEQSSRHMLDRICQQIEQQIQSLLSNLNTENSSQINIRLLDKCITSTKSAIMRVLSARLPQIVAIQEKCKMLVLEINQQLELQKFKAKEIFSKYEYQVLECDRYKMETVQLSDLYSAIYKENVQLKMQIEQKNKGTSKDIQTEQNGLSFEVEQKQQERQLYHEELAKNSQLISELRRNEEVSNERIFNLLEEDKLKQEIIEQNQLTIEMLKKQISDLVIEVEELKYKVQENSQTHELERKKIQAGYQTTINQSKEAYAAMSLNLNECKETLRKVEVEYAELTDIFKELQRKNWQKDQTIQRQSKDLSEQKQRIGELMARVGKIKDISRYQQKLEHKYSKKMELLTKHNSELSEKVKFLKSENERLYQAMDQYANKQMKLTNSLSTAESKLQAFKQKQNTLTNLKKRVRQLCLHTKKQILAFRKYLHGHLQTNIKNVLIQFSQHFNTLKADYELKLARRLSELTKQRENEREKLIMQIRNSEQEYRLLQQKSLESEINSNKVANALVDSKNMVYCQIAQKDQMIRSLEKQLAQEKQTKEKSNKKYAQLIKKYQAFNLMENEPNYPDYEQRTSQQLYLDKRLMEQKNRLLNLQTQYKAFMQT